MEDDVWLRADIEWRRAKGGVRSPNIRYPQFFIRYPLSFIRHHLSAIRYFSSAITYPQSAIFCPLFAPQKLRKSTQLFGDARALLATLVCCRFVHETKLHSQSIHATNLSRRSFGNVEKARELC